MRTSTGVANSKVTRIVVEADAGHLAERQAAEFHRRPDGQPAHGLMEDERVVLGRHRPAVSSPRRGSGTGRTGDPPAPVRRLASSGPGSKAMPPRSNVTSDSTSTLTAVASSEARIPLASQNRVPVVTKRSNGAARTCRSRPGARPARDPRW